MYKSFFKRIFDFLGALFLVLLLSPIFILVTLFLSFSNKGKPFFFQQRPGLKEKHFKIMKFKTMNDLKDTSGNLLSDTDRLTKVGSFVRKTSLDELPQLINVLKGEMSFIGPRPLLIRYLPFYTEKEKKRHTVRPGITGLAQVSGRNLMEWNDRLAADVEYVENLSITLDFRIFLKTIKNVLTSKDIIVNPSTMLKDLDEYRK